MLNTIATLAIAASMQPTACFETPPGVSPAVEDCMLLACKVYQDQVQNCNDAACETAAFVAYAIAFNQCDPVVKVGSTGFASIWYKDGEFGVTYDHVAPLGSIVYEF